jgi:zinc protease
LTAEPPSKEEVERAKTRLLKNIELEMNDSQAVALDLSEYAAQGDWRLLVPHARPHQGRHRGRRAARRQGLSEGIQPHAGQFIPTKSPDRAEIPATPDVAETLKDFKGGAVVAAGEAFDPSPANIESRVVRSTLPGG